MSQIDRSALVLHSAERMYDLVDQVDRYPEFLPGCIKTEVISRTDDELVATLYLAKAGLKYNFTTRNKLSRPENMTLTLEQGPFSRLTGSWQFIALNDEACKVVLQLEFAIANKIAGAAVAKVFEQLASTMVDAFVSRADQVYGG